MVRNWRGTRCVPADHQKRTHSVRPSTKIVFPLCFNAHVLGGNNRSKIRNGEYIVIRYIYLCSLCPSGRSLRLNSGQAGQLAFCSNDSSALIDKMVKNWRGTRCVPAGHQKRTHSVRPSTKIVFPLCFNAHVLGGNNRSKIRNGEYIVIRYIYLCSLCPSGRSLRLNSGQAGQLAFCSNDSSALIDKMVKNWRGTRRVPADHQKRTHSVRPSTKISFPLCFTARVLGEGSRQDG